MILVSGATGNVGGELVRQLVGAGGPGPGAARRDSSATDVVRSDSALPSPTPTPTSSTWRPRAAKTITVTAHHLFWGCHHLPVGRCRRPAVRGAPRHPWRRAACRSEAGGQAEGVQVHQQGDEPGAITSLGGGVVTCHPVT